MGHSASEMLSPKDYFGKLFILRNTSVDSHAHLPKHQSNQSPCARSSHKLEDMIRMQLVERHALGREFLLDFDHQRFENEQ